MREIKFRAWDEKGKRMLDSDIVDTWDVEYLRPDPKEPHIVMQYTGLKDKNDKDIYEGDILLVDDNGSLAPVHWDEQTFGFNIRYVKKPWKNLWEAFTFNSQVKEDCGIVGNIYENPELLNETSLT